MWSEDFLQCLLTSCGLEICSPNDDNLVDARLFKRSTLSGLLGYKQLHLARPYNVKRQLSGLTLGFHSKVLARGLLLRYSLADKSDP